MSVKTMSIQTGTSGNADMIDITPQAVSYTHLTLPTTPYV